MAVFTSASTTLSLSASLPASDSFANFDGLTGWNLVGEITDISEIGREYQITEHAPLGSRRKVKAKGSYAAPDLNITMGRDAGDTGQILINTALQSDNAYSFKIVLPNTKKVYFRGLVTAAKTNIGGVDSITGYNCTVTVVSDVYEG